MANENISECTLCEVRLNLPPNEASGLLVIENDALLEAHSWDCALWTILGEGGIQECIALMGHERGANMSEGWQTELLAARLMQLGVRQARYVGRAKRLFQLLMAATVANLTLVGMSTGLMRDRIHPKTIVSIHICALLATLIAICPIFATLSIDPRLWNHTWSLGFRPRF